MRKAGLVAAVVFGLSVPAYAADAPDIVGVWTPIDHSGSDFTVVPMDQMSKPIEAPELNKRPGNEGWSLRIDAQDGRAIAGAVISKGGKEQVLIGTFRKDGRRIVFATDFNTGSGEIDGNSMEVCWVDQIPNYISTSCSTYARAAGAAPAPGGKPAPAR